MKKLKKAAIILSSLILISAPVLAEKSSTPAGDKEGTYLADKNNLREFLNALSAKLKKPVIVSGLAEKKKISGSFDMSEPSRLLNRLAEKMGLIWYDDGQSVYVYDSSETRSIMISLKTTTAQELKKFLRSSSLYDERYPVRSDEGSKTFYLSGPPVYVKLVSDAAAFLDTREEIVTGDTTLNVIPLHNTFVNDRTYRYRDEQIIIPGMASIVNQLTGVSVLPAQGVISENNRIAGKSADDASNSVSEISDRRALFPEAATVPDALLIPRHRGETSAGDRLEGVTVVANPDNNSLLVRGNSAQVKNIRQLVDALDMPRRHVEMSVWIVDLQKEELDQLGVQWQGSVNAGSQIGVSLNGATSSTVDGATFMASVTALAEKNKANIVSRPMILTQENVPAVFDNNRTFYTKLIGERTSSLDHVTYGTSLSVLPRFNRIDEVELLLSIEDGSQTKSDSDQDMLPEVGRTNISTIARVPKGMSLLVGGYTRQENNEKNAGIPFLKDIPWIGGIFRYKNIRTSEMVRVFLIQPKEIISSDAKDGRTMIKDIRGRSADKQLLDWMDNFLESKIWQSRAR